MIKQSFLDSLEGLSVEVAKKKVVEAKHKLLLVPEGVVAIPLLALPNTVVIWQENGKVAQANAGDGVELDEDV